MRQILQKPDHEPAPSVDVIEISNCKNIVQMMRIFGMLENDLKLGAKQKPERKYFDEEKKRNGMTICLKFKMKSIKPKNARAFESHKTPEPIQTWKYLDIDF